MKRLMNLTILFLITLQLNATEIWVSPNGSDKNPGTKEQPIATILMAQRKVRELRRLSDPSIKDGVHIILKGGIYYQIDPIIFRPEDSGAKDCPTYFKNAPGEQVIISGGIKVGNWKKSETEIKGLPTEAQNNVWVAEIPKIGGNRILFRQMWVNGVKAQRASTLIDGELPRILSVNNENETFEIPLPKTEFHNLNGLEFVIHQWWAIAMLRVKNIEKYDNKAIISFHQPESRIEFEHPWPAPFIDEEKNLNGNSAYYFVNAVELLNKPGEWYEDLDAGLIYYWPKEGEDLSKAEIVVPYLETILKVEGTLDAPVTNIIFQGIGFEHTTWLRPSLKGHVPLQAGWSITDAYKLLEPGTPDKAALENQAWIERQSAGVTVENANNIQFLRCRFEHMAATGLDFISGTNNNVIEGNIIRDIGGTGLQLGFFGSPVFEAHVPYNPADEREVCNNEQIKNNLITDCTNEDWGCVGISVGYAHGINIEHNEVSHLNYSGICIGWGWTKTITCMKNNRVHANHIHHFAKNMYDVGGVYTLSAQPNTEISENSIHDLMKAPYAHIPEHYQYIYFDEGSSYIRAINNWTEKDKFFSNTPGPGNHWENNGPNATEVRKEIKEKKQIGDKNKIGELKEIIEIKENAGLQEEFKDLLIK